MRQLRTRKAMIVDDDPLFTHQLGLALDLVGGEWQVEHFGAAAPILEHIQRKGFHADLALVDLGQPDGHGLEVIRQMHKRLPIMPILGMSVVASERSLFAAIKAGVTGYLLKGGDKEFIVRGIRDVLRGQSPISPSLGRHLFRIAGAPQLKGTGNHGAIELTRREQDVLEGIARGLSYGEVADHLFVKLPTIQSHIRSLYNKLGANSRVQAVNRAREMGLLL